MFNIFKIVYIFIKSNFEVHHLISICITGFKLFYYIRFPYFEKVKSSPTKKTQDRHSSGAPYGHGRAFFAGVLTKFIVFLFAPVYPMFVSLGVSAFVMCSANVLLFPFQVRTSWIFSRYEVCFTIFNGESEAFGLWIFEVVNCYVFLIVLFLESAFVEQWIINLPKWW